jgi:hypothetical protein
LIFLIRIKNSNHTNINTTNGQQQQKVEEEKVHEKEVPSKFILPTGEVMDGKNTLQSFDTSNNNNTN